MIIINLYFFKVFAFSSSIGFHELRDEPLDWIDMYHNKTRTITGLPYTDILAVNYFSNGQILNSTLWLTSFKANTSSDNGKINYGIYIDADSNKQTGLDGIDYQVEISGQNGMWTRSFWQYSSLGDNRTIDIQKNYSGFYGKGKDDKYVLLSVNLDEMGFPDKYKVLFYTEQLKRNLIWKIDFTKWISIPSPDFDLIASPSILDLRQGEQKAIGVQVKSTTDFEPLIHLFPAEKNQSYPIDLKFNSTNLKIPANGMKVVPLNITVQEDAPLQQYTLQISANATFPAEQLIETRHPQSTNILIPSFVKSENVTKSSSLAITVNPKIPPLEGFIQWLNKWQFPITFMSGIVTGHIIPWFFNKIRKRKENKSNQKLDDYT